MTVKGTLRSTGTLGLFGAMASATNGKLVKVTPGLVTPSRAAVITLVPAPGATETVMP